MNNNRQKWWYGFLIGFSIGVAYILGIFILNLIQRGIL